MGIQLVFFLLMTTGPDDINNVLAPAFGILIVILVVAGSRRLADPIIARPRPDPRPGQLDHVHSLAPNTKTHDDQ